MFLYVLLAFDWSDDILSSYPHGSTDCRTPEVKNKLHRDWSWLLRHVHWASFMVFAGDFKAQRILLMGPKGKGNDTSDASFFWVDEIDNGKLHTQFC